MYSRRGATGNFAWWSWEHIKWKLGWAPLLLLLIAALVAIFLAPLVPDTVWPWSPGTNVDDWGAARRWVVLVLLAGVWGFLAVVTGMRSAYKTRLWRTDDSIMALRRHAPSPGNGPTIRLRLEDWSPETAQFTRDLRALLMAAGWEPQLVSQALERTTTDEGLLLNYSRATARKGPFEEFFKVLTKMGYDPWRHDDIASVWNYDYAELVIGKGAARLRERN